MGKKCVHHEGIPGDGHGRIFFEVKNFLPCVVLWRTPSPKSHTTGTSKQIYSVSFVEAGRKYGLRTFVECHMDPNILKATTGDPNGTRFLTVQTVIHTKKQCDKKSLLAEEDVSKKRNLGWRTYRQCCGSVWRRQWWYRDDYQERSESFSCWRSSLSEDPRHTCRSVLLWWYERRHLDTSLPIKGLDEVMNKKSVKARDTCVNLENFYVTPCFSQHTDTHIQVLCFY
jgi:hypothetical protein